MIDEKSNVVTLFGAAEDKKAERVEEDYTEGFKKIERAMKAAKERAAKQEEIRRKRNASVLITIKKRK